jgi:ketosteroid isomerase-like protein
VLAYGSDEAERLNHKHIGVEHLLLGLLREEKGLAAEVLHERWLRFARVREEIARSSHAAAARVSNIEIARQYLKAIEEGTTGEALANFFDPQVTQIEFPNRLNPKGGQRGLTALLEAAERGQKVMSNQSFTVLHELGTGNLVALEVLWEGTLAVPFQSLPSGATLRAHFAVFLEFHNGKILAQRNYDCFEPFPGE